MSALTDTFTSIANTIRAKTGKSATMTPAQMVVEIANLSGGNISVIEESSTTERTINLNESNTYYIICTDQNQSRGGVNSIRGMDGGYTLIGNIMVTKTDSSSQHSVMFTLNNNRTLHACKIIVT